MVSGTTLIHLSSFPLLPICAVTCPIHSHPCKMTPIPFPASYHSVMHGTTFTRGCAHSACMGSLKKGLPPGLDGYPRTYNCDYFIVTLRGKIFTLNRWLQIQDLTWLKANHVYCNISRVSQIYKYKNNENVDQFPTRNSFNSLNLD